MHSTLLSQRHKQMQKDGRHLTDDSKKSEKILLEAMIDIIAYANKRFDGGIVRKSTISLYECQEYFQECSGIVPNPENKKVYMRPDGSILYATIQDKLIPILVVEDKVQGTNDILFQENKPRQATGNAIERGAKNIRGCEMLFCNADIFPYVLFASGCDFHSSETIGKRIEMMNMGVPNHYIEVQPNMSADIQNIIDNIDIRKKGGKSIASVFVKAHKWNEMPHNSSMWTKEEYTKICCKVLDLVAESMKL